MTNDAALLERECNTFLRYLAARDAAPEVRAAYVRAHQDDAGADAEWAADAYDDPLVAFARSGRFAARLADTFSAVFDRRGALRRKLLLLTSILAREPESEPLRPAGRDTDSFAAWTMGASLVSLACFAFACVLLGPLWLVAGRRRGDETS